MTENPARDYDAEAEIDQYEKSCDVYGPTRAQRMFPGLDEIDAQDMYNERGS